ncbi:MAG: DivIVA domain-containing protein [Thermoanaerobaculaceae bacterium]|jgi:cell division initiation protein|nr:DivIVA domain-containing protein [Thermoanaerobaculaceae bacterium]
MTRLTPLEIQRASFPRRLQGLDPEAVRTFLSQVAEQVEEDARQRGELRAQIAKLTREVDEYRQRVDAVNEALVAAQHSAEQTLAKAEAEAQRIIAEAQTLADRLVEEATRRTETLEQVVAQLRTHRRTARADLKRLAEILAGVIADDEAAEQREGDVSKLSVLRPRDRRTRSER